MAKYNKIHDQITNWCKTAKTYSEVEQQANTTSPNGSLRRYIKINKIPMPCYIGQALASAISQKSRRNTSKKDLTTNCLIGRATIKRVLFREGLKEEKCERCGWCEQRPSDGLIPIQLHHKNGDGTDNRIENLEILCPNCHAMTENYCGLNKGKKALVAQW